MTAFYSLRHNSAYRAGVPQIYEIVEGLFDNGPCLSCRAPVRFPAGDLLVKLGDSPVDHWPDVMACGDYPCFVVSSRFLSAMGACQIATVLGGGIDFVSPVPSGLSLLDSPKYYWLDGKKHLAAKVDFDSSGFVGVTFCAECGNRHEDMEATYRRRREQPTPPLVFEYEESLGLELFTTDLSPTAFFCTGRVLECARANRLMNLQFGRTEDGAVAKPIRL